MTVHSRRATALTAGILLAAVVLAGCGDSPEEKQDKIDRGLDRALQLQNGGQDDRARDEFQKVLDLDPTNKYAVYNLALLDQLAGRTQEAEGKYRVVIKLDPQYQPALYNLGVILGAAGRSDEAAALYQRAIAARPNSANAHFNLALLMRAKGQKAEGDAAMRQALLLDPKLRDPAAEASTAPADVSTPRAAPGA